MKIAITGTPCSGKTTLARDLGKILNCQPIEIDALLFGPQWSSRPMSRVYEQITDALNAHTEWIFDGNKAHDAVWPAADMVIWLDYPLPLLLWRAAKRTVWRWLTREALWNGNQEHLLYHLTHRNSIFFIVYRDWKQRRRQYPLPFTYYPDVPITRLRSPQETQRWFNWFASTSESTHRQLATNDE